MRNNVLLILIFLQLDQMMEEKKAAMKDEADLGFTVIRVESSVSQLAEAEADTEAEQEDVAGVTSAGHVEEDDDEEEEEEEVVSVATETETKTEVETTPSELDSR